MMENLAKKSYINAVDEHRDAFSGSIWLKWVKYVEENGNRYMIYDCVLSLSSIPDTVWYGTMHVWDYLIKINCKDREPEIIDAKCSGGAVYTMKDKQVSIIEMAMVGKLLKTYVFELCNKIFFDTFLDVYEPGNVMDINALYDIVFNAKTLEFSVKPHEDGKIEGDKKGIV